MQYTLGVLGAGNMASAILQGIQKNSVLPASSIIICDINESALAQYSEFETTTDSSFLFKNCEYLLLAIKPQVFDNIANSIKDAAGVNYIISIMAGIKSSKIKSDSGVEKVFRIMPNTPCRIGEGMSVIAKNDYCEKANSFVCSIFESLGKTLVLDESLFDTVTSISGSGPAYVYYFIKAMIDSGVENGLTYNQSKLLTTQTFLGATKMIESSNQDIEMLIDAVCSKGGTTIEAIESFKSDNIAAKIVSGVNKCKAKSEILGRNF